MVEQNKFDWIIVSETHLTDEVDDCEINLSGYEVIRCDSTSKHTGGVAIMYIRNNWQYEVLKRVVRDMEFWLCVIRCWLKNKSYVVAVVYRSPSMSKRTFCSYFDQWMEDLTEYNCEVIVAGDLNINWDANDTYKCLIEQSIVDNGFKQVMNDYTRITKSTKTIIDYVATNMVNVDVKVDTSLKISDHETIRVRINVDKFSVDDENQYVRRLKYNKEIFLNKLVEDGMLQIESMTSVNESAEKFSQVISNAINEQMVDCKKLKKTVNKWYNSELKEMKAKKIVLYNRAVLTRNETDWTEYINVRNNYANKIKCAKNKSVIDSIQSARNQKELWTVIKSMVLQKTEVCRIQEIEFASGKSVNDADAANKLNKYFIESVNEINESIPYKQYESNVLAATSEFKFKEITLNELKNIVIQMNNKKDCNAFSVSMLLDSWIVIGAVLLKIINQSIIEGVFPQDWKESMVIPVEKVKGTKKCEEHRPINMLTIYEKVLEKVVKVQLEEYMEVNGLIIKQQSGFRKKHSCETALNWLMMQWKTDVDNNDVVCACFLDFKRAFETVDRDILIDKLEKYGVKGKEKMWFESYLKNRMQRTRVNNTTSEPEETKFGVPQGAVLGTLLFLIYINDIDKVLSQSKIMMFADDTLIYVSGRNQNECTNQITNELNKLSVWLKMNKLKLNASKTKYMVINGVNEGGITIDGENIDSVNELKYLGVVVDNKLNLKSHINFICKKLAKKVGLFRRIRKRITPLCAVHIYNVMIKPHFEYCSSIFLTCNDDMIYRLQKLQNKAMRTILWCSRYTSKREMLNALEWMDIKQRVVYCVLVFIFKIKNNLLPNYLKENLNYVSDAQYNLRNKNDFRIKYASSTRAQNTLMYKGLVMFNSLGNELKVERNLNVFKKKCVEFVKCYY